MVHTHTLLFPNMAPLPFSLLQSALESEGYHARMLENSSDNILKLGLKYVHNDTCYPALLIIGQFLDALASGDYDLDHTALLLTQTGGGCRASNYILLLRKALAKAGYANVPVCSLNFSGLEKDSSLPLSPRLVEKLVAAMYYGDLLMTLRNQVAPYEVNGGDASRRTAYWKEKINGWMNEKHPMIPGLAAHFDLITEDFANIPVVETPRVKVGIVGEIYVKYAPLGNRGLQDFLEKEGCEVCLPPLIGFVEYCIANRMLDIQYYGGSHLVEKGASTLLEAFMRIDAAQAKALTAHGFHASCPFRELMKKPEGILHLGASMGEGWLLTAEMVELVESGYANIICAQPFGCLPNHIAGKGVISRIREKLPEANITAVDYDPGASAVNQENRIRLMLAVAKERLQFE